jgi:hypothetical protein
MGEMEEVLERRRARLEKQALAKEKRQEKSKTVLENRDHQRCQAEHTWYEAADRSGLIRNVEICSEANLEELALMGYKFGWEIKHRGLWSERKTAAVTRK